MVLFQKTNKASLMQFKTDSNGIHDITKLVEFEVEKSRVKNGLVNVCVEGSKAAIMIQQNGDPSIQVDFNHFLRNIITLGFSEKEILNCDSDAHIKASIIGPTESIQIMNGKLGLLSFQKIYLCEFDHPGKARNILMKFIRG